MYPLYEMAYLEINLIIGYKYCCINVFITSLLKLIKVV